MKIVILDAITLGNVNLEVFKRFGELEVHQSSSDKERLTRTIDANIIISNKVLIDKALMDNAPALKLVCIAATGLNNVDLAYAKAKGIEIKNVAAYSTESVAQHTFAMLLSMLNRIHYYDDYVKSGLYAKSDIFTHHAEPFFNLEHKQFGIIGLGSIGKKVALIAESFGCKIAYYSTSGKNNVCYYEQLSLEYLMQKADIVSIHAPLNENTHNLIDYNIIKLAKPSAIIINAGRGGIVNEKDLALAIDEKIITGACVDVFTEEPINQKNPLLSVKYPERIILTPHMAWASIESRETLIEKLLLNIQDYLEAGSAN